MSGLRHFCNDGTACSGRARGFLLIALFAFATCCFLSFQQRLRAVLMLSSAILEKNETSANVSCSERVDRLSRHIRSDQEKLGLLPWTDDGVGESFSGLDEALVREAFIGRRIFFWGDSTTKNLNYWLHHLLTMMHERDNSTEANETSLDFFREHRLSRAIGAFVNQTVDDCVVSPLVDAGSLSCNNGYTGYHARTTLAARENGTMTANWHQFASGAGPFDDVYKSMKGHQPDVVVANMGLWWFHFQNLGRNKGPDIVKIWRDYESFLRETVDAAEESGAKALFFKTTNAICPDKFRGNFAKAIQCWMHASRSLYNWTETCCLRKIVP